MRTKKLTAQQLKDNRRAYAKKYREENRERYNEYHKNYHRMRAGYEKLLARKTMEHMLRQKSKKITSTQKELLSALKEAAKYKSLYEQLLGRKTRKPGILQRFFN